MDGEVRKSVIAGSWYPGNPRILKADIQTFFDKAPDVTIEGDIVGLVSPHAGYVYSGQVAAYAYKSIIGQVFDAVILVGPSHRALFRGVSVYDQGGYETPLGVVPVDKELAQKMMASSPVIASIPSAHAQEHSLEIQLPFLQAALGEFPFVPLVMGDQNRQTCIQLADAIFRAIEGRHCLVVGSSDLSHFHPHEKALKLDTAALRRLETMDDEGLLADLARHDVEACGGGPMAVTMMVAKKLGAKQAKVMPYANSGDITGDRSSVVGYASALFFKQGWKAMNLSSDDKKNLLDAARKVIEAVLDKKDLPDFYFTSAILQEKRGVFVTLKKRNQLRGCIGYIEGIKPLYQAVQEMAVAAAFRDPRFPPLKAAELEQLEFEISVLSPLEEVKSLDRIEIGRHGLYMVKGFRSGLLLPQVAVEHGWDRETFLTETCHKAGLPSQAWKDKDSKIYIFSADIFGSRENLLDKTANKK